MFCPKCATQNVEGASYCRVCGANISLVPQALSGQLRTAAPNDDDPYRKFRKKRGREPTIEEGIRYLISGIAFVIVSILVAKYSPSGWAWWYWLLIPASTYMGKGISQLIRFKQAKASMQSSSPRPIGTGAGLETLAAPRTGELMKPVPSVTEGTTRHLGTEAATRQFDSFENQKPS
jgi:zinc-ribbon domain